MGNCIEGSLRVEEYVPRYSWEMGAEQRKLYVLEDSDCTLSKMIWKDNWPVCRSMFFQNGSS